MLLRRFESISNIMIVFLQSKNTTNVSLQCFQYDFESNSADKRQTPKTTQDNLKFNKTQSIISSLMIFY